MFQELNYSHIYEYACTVLHGEYLYFHKYWIKARVL